MGKVFPDPAKTLGAVEAVALETGNLTPWLTAALRAEGFRVVVLEARQVKTTLPRPRTMRQPLRKEPK